MIIFQKHSEWSRLYRIGCLSALLLGWSMGITGCKKQSSHQLGRQSSLHNGFLAVPPAGSAYTGAYLASGEAENQLTLEKIEEFEKNVGKHQAIIASSSFWGEQTFPAQNLEIIARHGSIPLIFWSPWDKPYTQGNPPDRFSLRAILAGKWDAYIDLWADGAKKFRRPLLVSWGLEMNGTWFPWSGYFYRAQTLSSKAKLLGKSNIQKNLGAEIYKQAYRYVVDRVRKRGATNILWVFHVNSYSYPSENWNAIAQYYPGSDYVDWLALSTYGSQFPDDPWITVKDTFYYPYRDICALDPKKPVMLAEWGVADLPRLGNKAAWLAEAFEMLTRQFPRIKAAVFWNERWQNSDGSFSNLRVTSSVESLEAYRRGVSSPFWLAYPIVSQ